MKKIALVAFMSIVLLVGITLGAKHGQWMIRTALAAVTASTFSAQYDRALDPIFLKKVEQAALTEAITVMGEADTGTLWHQRKALALAVLQSPTTMAALMAKGAASNVAITDSSTDSDIAFTVNTYWDSYAYGR